MVHSHEINCRLPLAIRGGLLLILVVAVLHTLDRQGEFVSRTDFLWKAKLKVEQEEVETMRGINKVRNFSNSKNCLKFLFNLFLKFLNFFCNLFKSKLIFLRNLKKISK